MNNLLFSVIIPTCNRTELLAKCLLQLAPGTQTLDGNCYEVIVTDDSIGNETEAMLKEKISWVRYTRGPRRGPAANRNHGAKLAQAPWLVFTDDDCLPDVGWLQAYANAIQQHPDCKAFEGAILPDDRDLLKKDMAECPVNDNGAAFWSANIMMEHELFLRLGGFDASFELAANEDQEIFYRVKKESHVEFIGTAIVIHPVRIVSFWKKLNMLPGSERSQVLYRKRLGYSFLKNWQDGILIHGRALWANIGLSHWKRAGYNCVGLFYRLLFSPIIILSAGAK